MNNQKAISRNHSQGNGLDKENAEAGGRLYLAKDSRQSAKAFQICYALMTYLLIIPKRMDAIKRLILIYLSVFVFMIKIEFRSINLGIYISEK